MAADLDKRVRRALEEVLLLASAVRMEAEKCQRPIEQVKLLSKAKGLAVAGKMVAEALVDDDVG